VSARQRWRQSATKQEPTQAPRDHLTRRGRNPRRSRRGGGQGTGFVTTTRSFDPLGLNHFGLASMRQQIEMAGGTWQLHSRPGHGTTITVTVADPGSGRLLPQDHG